MIWQHDEGIDMKEGWHYFTVLTEPRAKFPHDPITSAGDAGQD